MLEESCGTPVGWCPCPGHHAVGGVRRTLFWLAFALVDRGLNGSREITGFAALSSLIACFAHSLSLTAGSLALVNHWLALPLRQQI
jgi:hypothetical protein